MPPTGNEDGLVGYWDFEEEVGNKVLDVTGNGNNGIINGANFDTNVPSQSCQLTTINGCDSTAVLNLVIENITFVYDTIGICNGENISVGNNIYYQSGTYTDTLQNLNGCDSIVFTTIETLDVNIIESDTSICNGNEIILNATSSLQPSISLTLTSSLPSCVWIALNTSFADYADNLNGYEYYCSCWPSRYPNTQPVHLNLQVVMSHH